MSDDELLRYPIGRFTPRASYSPDEVQHFIHKIEILPQTLGKLVMSLSATQLDTPYREGGWTARQVIHHMADSHMNAYIRTKWMLTENSPVIKAYDEKAWAETPETLLDPALSVALLTTLHAKWTALLYRLGPDDLTRKFIHPETKKEVPMDRNIATYAWHGEHHCGHLAMVSGRQ